MYTILKNLKDPKIDPVSHRLHFLLIIHYISLDQEENI